MKLYQRRLFNHLQHLPLPPELVLLCIPAMKIDTVVKPQRRIYHLTYTGDYTVTYCGVPVVNVRTFAEGMDFIEISLKHSAVGLSCRSDYLVEIWYPKNKRALSTYKALIYSFLKTK